MAFRSRINRRQSRKQFRRGVMRVKARNYAPAPMRGGIRL